MPKISSFWERGFFSVCFLRSQYFVEKLKFATAIVFNKKVFVFSLYNNYLSWKQRSFVTFFQLIFLNYLFLHYSIWFFSAVFFVIVVLKLLKKIWVLEITFFLLYLSFFFTSVKGLSFDQKVPYFLLFSFFIKDFLYLIYYWLFWLVNLLFYSYYLLYLEANSFQKFMLIYSHFSSLLLLLHL